MHMKYLVFPLIFSWQYCLAQHDGEASIVDFSVNPGGVINETFYKKWDTSVKNSYLMEWAVGNIRMVNGHEIKNIPMRYDQLSGNIEVRLGAEDTRICPNQMFKEFQVLDVQTGNLRSFENASLYEESIDMTQKSVVEVLYKDSVVLGKLHFIEIKRPTYVRAFDMGEKSSTVIQKHWYLLIQNGIITRLTKKMRKDLHCFGEFSHLIKEYMQQENLKWLEKNDMVRIFKLYNEEIKKGG